MKAWIDTDPYIYSISHSLQPSCYWVDGEWHEDYYKTLKLLKEQERPKEDMEKEQFLLPPWEIKPRVNSVLNAMTKKLKAEVNSLLQIKVKEYEWVLSSKGNFRKDIDLEYKGHRPPKPRWHGEVRKVIKNKTKAWSFPELEADDVIAYLHYQMYKEVGEMSTVIAAIDKDFDIIPGWHYHIRDSYMYYVNEEEALNKFKEQLIIGDKSDNIPGIKGMGEKKAQKWIDENPTESLEEFRELVITELYKDQFDFPEDRYDTNFTLLDIGGVYTEKLDIELSPELKELRNV